MTSTEQKNIVQPFIDSCYTYGILPTIVTGCFDDFPLCTEGSPFSDLGPTPNFGARLRASSNPIEEARAVLPSLRNAGAYARASAFLLRLCSDSRVFSGNMAVCRLAEMFATHKWGLHVGNTDAYRHAKTHTAKVGSLLAPGSYSRSDRLRRGYERIGHTTESGYLRRAADAIDLIRRSSGGSKETSDIRRWSARHREATGARTRYRRESDAVAACREFDPSAIHATELPPAPKQKLITVSSQKNVKLAIYHYGSQFIFRFSRRTTEDSSLYAECRTRPQIHWRLKRAKRFDSETFFLNNRDMDDLKFLLQSMSQIKIYHSRRLRDTRGRQLKYDLETMQNKMWNMYLTVMRKCGDVFELRNKLGVYFDVLQWRYLAWKSGDIYYDHSRVMSQKIVGKGLVLLPAQDVLLDCLKGIPMDMAIDMMGIYKASIYPEVDPFEVVVSQYKLHYSRHNTEWEPGSAEYERREDTKAYMWYFGVRVLYSRTGVWPGRIRDGVETKSWHAHYKHKGIPGARWQDARDVDLTGCVPVANITNEQYIRQQDSACAPPLRSEYESFDAMRSAPRRHRRKLLYAVQETDYPDLPQTMEYLNGLGRQIPNDFVGQIEYDLPFSVDIVTGSRCERHKDAPRPFYAASPPWGCILSYIDGITRDFLNHVPQSMLGKSTKQKYSDLRTASRASSGTVRDFYMSDDKAKYSPRMDPQSQQIPAEFFAELFDLPAIRAFGPIMYHCELYYRVCGHLVKYNANGTDREGMRGASNTWLEIVAQGLSTRLCRSRELIRGKSVFLSFIDDGLRRFSVEGKGKTSAEIMHSASLVIEDVIFGLKVLGRELSWDKTFISSKLFVMLNEVMYEGSHFSSGLKSFCTAGDIEMKEVMSAADYEQLYFGKMRGSLGVGVPLDLCHYIYLFETLMSHRLMGVNLQDNHSVSELEYRLFCITPMAFGGGGIRSSLQMCCNEVGSTTKEGIGMLQRLATDRPILAPCVCNILTQEPETLSPIDFMREPEQFHVAPPRIRTQRLAAEVRKQLYHISENRLSRQYVRRDQEGMKILEAQGKIFMALGDSSAEEIRLLYSSSPVAFIDEFIQKLASSTTLAEVVGKTAIGRIRRQNKRDIIDAVNFFRNRCGSYNYLRSIREDPRLVVLLPELLR